ncbi:hypothetical protein KVR01_003437 [Diaporthe batatas]|uniref:uncharacterized protein n=1 Tax=Diaporthe batatas TaxID=748121 RepID=UPI001D04B705|nr:uncharacterized protein KVR01_003437 [Diaporthe batatas]KAG8167748.1 hypothetical protein KVR01_003437 [Diaporthe batatas]
MARTTSTICSWFLAPPAEPPLAGWSENEEAPDVTVSILQLILPHFPPARSASCPPELAVTEEEASRMLLEMRAEEGAVMTPQATPYKPGAKAPLSKRAFWRLLLTIEISMFGIAIDVAVIPVAVPSLSSYNLGYLNSAWIGTAFLASFALGFLIWPRVCKGFAHKFSFAVAMEAFNLAAVHSPPSSAQTVGRLIAMRAMAGAGAGGAYAIFEMVLRDIVPPKEFNKYMSASRMIWAVAAVGGPLASGALVDCGAGPLSYELGPFIGTVGYIMALSFLNLPGPSWADIRLNLRQFDYLGSLLLTAGTFFMLLVPASGGGAIFPWISAPPVGLCIAGVALLAAFCFIEPLVPDPLLHPSLFLDRSLLMTAMVAFFYGANLFGTLYYVPHFFQLVLDDGAFVSGVSSLPMVVGMAVGAAGATFLISRQQIRTGRIAQGGAALTALASGLMVRWGTNTSRAEAVVVLGLLGLGQGTAFIGLVRSTQTYVDHSPSWSGSRIFTLFQALGSGFGVACFAAVYMPRLQSSLGVVVADVAETLATDIGNFKDEYTNMGPRLLDAYGSSMRAGWYLMFACALAVSALTFVLERCSIRNDFHMSDSDGYEKVPGIEKSVY